MRFRGILFSLLFAMVLDCAHEMSAQTDAHTKGGGAITIYGGYSYLSNSFNNHSTASEGSGMNGWTADATLPALRICDLKLEGLGFYNNNLGDPERAHFILAGPVVKHRVGKDILFAQGLVGYGRIDAKALSFGAEGANTNTFAADLGGGFDLPIAPRVAWRLEGGVLRSAFSAQDNQISGLPRWFGRFSTGVVMHF